MNSRADATRDCVTLCAEREVAVLRHLARSYLKMSKQPKSFDAEKCVTKMSNCQPFGTASDLTEINKKKKNCVGGIVREIN